MNGNRKSLFQIWNPDLEQESNCVDSTRSVIDEDHISKLPDEVLRQILSIHPLDSGSKAVVLFTGLVNRSCIKREKHVKLEEFESVIGDFLNDYDENKPLKKPIKLEFQCSNDLIVTATIGLNKKLNLDFSKGDKVFPRQFEWVIVLNTMDVAHSSPYPFSVKTLKLTSVNYLSCELVSSFISKFRYVETLIIEKCNGLRFLRIEGLAKLTNLSVLDCVDLECVYVEALELKSLRYSGALCRFSFKDVIYLNDAKLDFKFDLRGSWSNDSKYPWRTIRDVKVLTLQRWVFQEVLREKHFIFSQLEDLWWIDNCMEDHNINALFSFLKLCTSLKRLFISIDTQSYSKPCDGDFERSTKVEKGPLRKLKVVKLEGFEKEEDIILLKEHLMEVFNVEPRVVEVRKGMHSRCLLRIPKRQTNYSKVIRSEKSKFTYRFVEEIEDNTGLCSKHPHMP